jgi:hypothetical protein
VNDSLAESIGYEPDAQRVARRQIALAGYRLAGLLEALASE